MHHHESKSEKERGITAALSVAVTVFVLTAAILPVAEASSWWRWAAERFGIGAEPAPSRAMSVRETPRRETAGGLSSGAKREVTSSQSASRTEATIPLRWGDLGARLVSEGVIDEEKLRALYEGRGGLTEDEERLLTAGNEGNLVVTSENAPFVLNLLWAFGLANENTILTAGAMSDPQYGGPGVFASTGGWTLARGEAMEHYAKHAFVRLTEKEQALVRSVAENIYRPCCDNPTHFPDCNHGMAMLGLLELMASQGRSEEEIYRAALAVNELWFPETYAAIREYLVQKGRSFESESPKTLLGREFSSASGYRKILEAVSPRSGGGGSCGV